MGGGAGGATTLRYGAPPITYHTGHASATSVHLLGPFLLHLTKDPSGTCLEGAVNNAGVLHKKCSKGSSYQKFNYAPSIGSSFPYRIQ